MNNEKDNSKVQLAILAIGFVIFLVLFVLTCIYSRKNAVEMFFDMPFCFAPYAEIGLACGMFFGISKDLRRQTRLLFKLFWKLVIAALVFETIRACVTHGSDALLSILSAFGEDDESDKTFAGYSLINVIFASAAMLLTMFLGRALGGLFCGKDDKE